MEMAPERCGCLVWMYQAPSAPAVAISPVSSRAAVFRTGFMALAFGLLVLDGRIINAGRSSHGRCHRCHTTAHGALQRGRVGAGHIVAAGEQAGCDAQGRAL